MLRTVMIAAILMAAASLMAVRFVDRTGRAPAAPVAAASAPTNVRSLVIKAGEGGHFAVEGRVDGRPIAFLVDTGASQIALRESDAARLGFHPTSRDYSIKIATANGEGHAALVQLGTVEIGGIVVRDLPALVTSDEALPVNLLGMSFLSRLRWSHERGQLILEQ